jgi:hypothetical protein
MNIMTYKENRTDMNPKIKKLLPPFIQEAFGKQGYTGDKQMNEIKIICKLFNPCGVGTFWLYEHVEDDIYMGFCLLNDPSFAEIGTVSLDELTALKLPLGLSIERDLHFHVGEKTLEQVWNEVKGR